MKYEKAEVINLKTHKEYNEKWLQARIEEDPMILGLGDIQFRHTEKILVGGGRLDTILYDPESNKRYEVEIQLGKTDESHIIRTIEYWDIERKRNPQYEHCAVIIAEDITSRFLNVISLFNGFIPLVAIQVKAVKVGDCISLIFTKVLDETRFDLLEEDEFSEPTDRNYWEKRASTRSLQLTDELMRCFGELMQGYQLKYNKHYIGIAKDNVATNFISFIPRKNAVILNIKLEQSDETDQFLSQVDLDQLAYDRRWRYYRLRISESDLKNSDCLDTICKLIEQAKDIYLE